MDNCGISQTVSPIIVPTCHLLKDHHVEHNTSGCEGKSVFLDFNMAGRSEDESVSNSSGESR